MADQVVRCRMQDHRGNRCVGEALVPDGDVLICTRHTALVIEMMVDKGVDMTLMLDVSGALRREREGQQPHTGLSGALADLRVARSEAREVRAEAREARAEAREIGAIVRGARAGLRGAAPDA